MSENSPKPLAILVLLALAGCGESGSGKAGAAGAPPSPPPPPEVGYVVLHPASIPFLASIPGRTVASAVSEIRPQVSGIVLKRPFKEGSLVKAGDILYEIDDRTYRAALDSTQASVEKAQATTDNAEIELKRQEQLLQRNTVAQSTVDTARATLRQAQADLALARANLQSAQINLDNTKVKAPISGLIGTSSVTEGALVTANQTAALTTIRQVDPMYVDLTESGETILRVRREIDQGKVQLANDGAKVRLTLGDGTRYGEVGSIEAFEGSVSGSTGAMTIRASIPNPQRILLPGLYVRATVEVGNRSQAFLVPQMAVSRNPKGQATALFVTADGKAESRLLLAADSYGTSWIIRDGVKDGDRLIVDGVQKARPGQAVRPVEVRIGEDGVARLISAAPAAGSAPAPAPTGSAPAGSAAPAR
ncbi:efflux RND transporter periplasmic adaptor subunit [Prosthecodimorpha staleyi]|uniref:Efflux RND transporter periplasmic adaptor subunit n=1 Tax=Prosthecodimorpha staleyi TaxID=2840188 RepID=A0A947D4K7_9HYPH|nr:efflux RND transporter periplasmic adaptor subunit [Prosthecodimorpha staleyi]MBT9290665.1 efflux RND transporter periplasmic adaptor subunit [Prosthecodimorpha staleyi]